MSDDRPIKPDQKYLEAYIERISKVEPKSYLKRKSSPALPCHQQHNLPHSNSPPPAKSVKSKAQLYEEIKRKNREKFGEKKESKAQQQQKEQKKLDPKRMTVDYRAKKKIHTEEYRKKDYQPKPVQSKKEKEGKVEYDKLLQLYRGELQNLEREKSEFKEVASKLKFKQVIKQEQGLLFSAIRSQVAQSCIKKAFSPAPSKENKNSNVQHKRQKDAEEEVKHPRFGRTYTASQIKQGIEEQTRKTQSIKEGLRSPELSVNEHRYRVDQLHLLPAFSPSAVFELIDPLELQYDKNSLYVSAVRAFNKRVQSCHPEQVQEEHASKCETVLVKWVGDKRVSKHEEWTEVWTPGRQRLMQKEEEGYMVAWLGNGDVRQQFSNEIKLYFSRQKGILKMEFRKEKPIYYHPDLQQLWWYLPSGGRQIVFANGRKEVISQ